MRKIKVVKLNSFKNKSGKLTPITFDKTFPFKVKRFFYIKGKKNYVRGSHAHKRCLQLFVPIIGKIELTTISMGIKKKIILNANNDKSILVPNLVWCSVKFLSQYSVIMVICDRNYEFNDYIEKFDIFEKLEKNKLKF